MSDRFELQGESLVVDTQTGLMWQREASSDRMVWKDGFGYIEQLNQNRFAGYGDWRYPTKEELATLILTEEDRLSGLYISSLFGSQRNCWAATEGEHHQACYVDFYYGDVYLIQGNYANHFVRAVRNS